MVASGDGSVSGPNPTTGANGIATVGSWVLGGIAGQNTLTAQSPGLSGSPATFTATAAAGQAATMTVVEGDDQSAAAGVAVPVAPKVRARDAFGNNVDGVPVSFDVSAGGGSGTGAAQSTGADGTAAVGSWTLGPTPGTNQLTATANTPGIMGNPIVFDATATALFNVGRYVGTWTGTWINNTFASTGTNTLTIAADPSAMTVTIAFSTTGNALGTGGGVPTQSNMTAYDDGGFTATATLNVYGTTTITVDADGDLTASGVNIPAGGIDRWDAMGTITDTQLVLDWTITFSGGGTATGRTTLTKQ
jgi:adhesin/invasin